MRFMCSAKGVSRFFPVLVRSVYTYVITPDEEDTRSNMVTAEE